MKRFAMALMLLIVAISYTGFGATTTDPAENSTSQNIVQEDDQIGTVVMDLEFEVLFQDDFQKKEVFKTHSSSPNLFLTMNLRKTSNEVLLTGSDFPNAQLYRSPRDGLIQEVYFFHN